MINTLHIHGSFYGKAPQHLYTYGEGAQKTTWQNYIWDTRPYTANIPQCYALWCTADGWWISVLAMNGKHSGGKRTGIVEMAFCLGHNRPKNGREAIKFLDGAINDFVHSKPELDPLLDVKKIENFGPGCHFWKDADTQQWLTTHPLELVPCSQGHPFNLGVMPVPAFRTYSSSEELATFLTSLGQKGYEQYARIFLVTSADGDKMRDRADYFDAPLALNLLTIHCPIGVQCVQTEAKEGDELMVTYKKEGFEPIVKHILAGDATYGTASDSAYGLFPASQIGLRFCRRIYVDCHDEKGMAVNNARVFCNGLKLEQDMETLKLYHDCPENETSVKLRVSHENYETYDKIYEIRQNRQQITIPLVLKGYNVVLKIDEATLKAERVKVGSLEYCSLMKHGARISGDTIFLNVVRVPQTLELEPEAHAPSKFAIVKSKFLEELKHNNILQGVTIGAIVMFSYLFYSIYCWNALYHNPWPFYHKRTSFQKTQQFYHLLVKIHKNYIIKRKTLPTLRGMTPGANPI